MITHNLNLVSSEQLKDITGYHRHCDIARCLGEQGIKLFWGKDGPWTTLDLINYAGGLDKSHRNIDKYGADTIL